MCLLTHPAAPPWECSGYTGTAPLTAKRSADGDTAAITDGLIELFGNAFDPLCRRIECTDYGIGRSLGAVARNQPGVMADTAVAMGKLL